MNSHEFREVVRDLDSATIRKNNINPAHFKAVAFALSMYGDYKSGTNIRPSWLTVAKDAGVDRKTAMKVRDFLIASGILWQVSKTEGNIAVYEFSYDYNFSMEEEIPEGVDYSWTSESIDQLCSSAEQLSNSNDQLSHIDGHNIDINTTINSIKIKQNVNEKIKGRVPNLIHSSLTGDLEW